MASDSTDHEASTDEASASTDEASTALPSPAEPEVNFIAPPPRDDGDLDPSDGFQVSDMQVAAQAELQHDKDVETRFFAHLETGIWREKNRDGAEQADIWWHAAPGSEPVVPAVPVSGVPARDDNFFVDLAASDSERGDDEREDDEMWNDEAWDAFEPSEEDRCVLARNAFLSKTQWRSRSCHF